MHQVDDGSTDDSWRNGLLMKIHAQKWVACEKDMEYYTTYKHETLFS